MPARRATEELAVLGDHIEVVAGAEVDDHRRPAIEVVDRDCVGDASAPTSGLSYKIGMPVFTPGSITIGRSAGTD